MCKMYKRTFSEFRYITEFHSAHITNVTFKVEVRLINYFKFLDAAFGFQGVKESK